MATEPSLNPVAAEGAMLGVRAGLSLFNVEADDEFCTQVAMCCLTGFVLHEGLQAESLERLRNLVVALIERTERRHDA